MAQFSSGVGLVPEQAWEDPDLAASPFGSDPTTASIGFTDGQAAGSASPLTWAQAQELRLILDIGAGRTLETPSVTTHRYVTHGPPGSASLTLTAPAPGTAVAHRYHRRSPGRTAPGAQVVVESLDTTTGAPSATATATAARGRLLHRHGAGRLRGQRAHRLGDRVRQPDRLRADHGQQRRDRRHDRARRQRPRR